MSETIQIGPGQFLEVLASSKGVLVLECLIRPRLVAASAIARLRGFGASRA